MIIQDRINSKPPTGVINAIDLKLNDVSEFVAKPYIEPEKNSTPKITKKSILFFTTKFKYDVFATNNSNKA